MVHIVGLSVLVQVQTTFKHVLCTTLLLFCRSAKGDHGLDTKAIREISELGWEGAKRTSCIPRICHCFRSNASPRKSYAPGSDSAQDKCAPPDNTLHRLADVACVAGHVQLWGRTQVGQRVLQHCDNAVVVPCMCFLLRCSIFLFGRSDTAFSMDVFIRICPKSTQIIPSYAYCRIMYCFWLISL